MPVKTHPSAGKYYEGPVHGGENKDKLITTREYEFTGVYKSGPNPKLNPVVGYTSQHDGKEESRTFSGLTPGYAGPQRLEFKAKDLGVRHPDDLEHS